MEKNWKKERKKQRATFLSGKPPPPPPPPSSSSAITGQEKVSSFTSISVCHYHSLTRDNKKKEERRKLECVCLWAIDRRLGQPACR